MVWRIPVHLGEAIIDDRIVQAALGGIATEHRMEPVEREKFSQHTPIQPIVA